MDKNIMLIGFMGVGKSTVSRALSTKTGMPEVDADAYIVEREGMAITDIFEKYGEDYFRDIETECLRELQEQKGRIISCGGGAVLRDENVEIMKEGGMILLLTAKPETIFQRVRYSKDRPILNGHMNVEYIAELMNKRNPRYTSVADIIIETDDKEIDQIVTEIEQALKNS